LQDAVALMIHQLHHAQTKALVLRIVPMFLGMGKHAREDLPELAIQLRATHPQVTFEIAATIGEDERVTRLLAHIAAH
jgi:sirohydrochlorin cobaltochelatase